MADNKLLVVEDSKVFASMLKTLIEKTHGLSVDVAYSYEELGSILKQADANSYFAAVVDRHLPDAPAGEAIDLVVQYDIPTIVFTGTADEAIKEDLWEKNISDYAHKSSAHSLEYVVWMVDRLHNNSDVDVLVVDESLMARKTMKKLLKTQRFNVHVAENGESALSILKEHPNIQLAIVDCKMEGMNGYELASSIRALKDKDSLEIIGVSAGGGRSNSAQFIKAGADDFLLKPFMPEEFFCRVNRAVDRIAQYEKLKELNQQKNQFLSTAAHDIRGPLGAIYNASRLLQKEGFPVERKAIVLQMIENNSRDMQLLLNDLLDLSAIESKTLKLNLEPIDLEQVIKDRIQLYSEMSEAKNIEVAAEFDDIPKLTVDRIKLNQAIDNLLTNALKYSPNNGSVRIELKANGNNLNLHFIDSGPGVLKEEEDRLFQPFQTLSGKATAGEKQTGLGLVIAKNIVEAHDGTLTYKPAPKGGACFSITLPQTNSID